MTPKDIGKLLKLSQQLRIQRLKVGDVEFEFFPNGEPGQATVWKKPHGVATPAKALKSQEETADKSALQEEIDLRRDELDELLISDPVKYEQMLLAGELDERRKTEETGDREQITVV